MYFDTVLQTIKFIDIKAFLEISCSTNIGLLCTQNVKRYAQIFLPTYNLFYITQVSNTDVFYPYLAEDIIQLKYIMPNRRLYNHHKSCQSLFLKFRYFVISLSRFPWTDLTLNQLALLWLVYFQTLYIVFHSWKGISDILMPYTVPNV